MSGDFKKYLKIKLKIKIETKNNETKQNHRSLDLYITLLESNLLRLLFIFCKENCGKKLP